jgi:hypothetical protein
VRCTSLSKKELTGIDRMDRIKAKSMIKAKTGMKDKCIA